MVTGTGTGTRSPVLVVVAVLRKVVIKIFQLQNGRYKHKMVDININKHAKKVKLKKI